MRRLLRLFCSGEFLAFLVVGGISSVVNLACGYALYSATPLPYTLCVFLGALSGLVVNFLLNYFFYSVTKSKNNFFFFDYFFFRCLI